MWIVALETSGGARLRRPGAGGRAGRRGDGGFPPRRRLLGGRPRPVEPGEPAPVPVTRATVIDTRPIALLAEADAWIAQLDLPAEAAGALSVVNRLIGAHRIAAADPYAHHLARDAPVVARAGYGAGAEVARGEWTRALELAPGRPGRRAALRPDERLAAILAARDRPLACEELALRARLDLDLDRPLAAALGTRLALEAALVELGGDARASGLEARLLELRDLRDDVIAAANSALLHSLTAAHRASMAHALGRIEATLRARSARTPVR